MEQPYIILKEFFKNNYYPPELLNYIIIFYHKVRTFEIYFGKNTLIRTPSNDIYYFSPTEAGYKIKKIELPNIRKMIHNEDSSYAITNSNELYAWGDNGNGQLGLDRGNKYQSDPTKVNLPEVKDLVCGYKNVLAITRNGDPYYWGQVYGYTFKFEEKPRHVTLSHVRNIYCDRSIQFAVTDSNKVYTWKDNDMKVPKRVKFIDKVIVKNIVTGFDYAFFLTSSDQVYAYGNNITGQLGLGHTNTVKVSEKVQLPPVRKVIHQSVNTIAITLTNEVYRWSYKDHLPVKMDISNVKDIVCGSRNILALTYDNELYSWKFNDHEHLGIFDDHSYIPLKMDLSNVREIICKNYTSFAITYTNELYAWGGSESGNLGLGQIKIVQTPQKVQIENVRSVFCGVRDLTIITTQFGEIYYCGKWYGSNTNIPKKLEF